MVLAIAPLAFAQHITTAKLETVAKSGLHKIDLPPEIRSFSKEDLSDFRIYNAKGNEIPYYLYPENQKVVLRNFDEFPILSRTAIPKKSTTIVIENQSEKPLNQISLRIGNSDVIKTYNLSGSNDKEQWFGLSNKQTLSHLNSLETTSSLKTIPFPLSSYRYLKIDFNDQKTLPINVLKVGNFRNQIQDSPLAELIPNNSKTVLISAEKKSLIHLTFENKQIINQITFRVSSPAFYKRAARIYCNKSRKVKRRTEYFQETILNFELNSNTKNEIVLPQIFEKEISIAIDNQDNQPLNFSEIKLYQIPLTLIADLKANENYTLKTGLPNLKAPQYDLENFKNKIHGNLAKVQIIEIKQEKAATNHQKNKPFWQHSLFLWICIALGGMALLYFSIRLVQDMKNNS